MANIAQEIECVVFTSTTTGTGTWTITGTKPWSSGTADSDLVLGTQYAYFAQYDDDTTSGWELGLGTYTSSSPLTFTRDTVIKSSAGATQVNFTGDVRISLTLNGDTLRDIALMSWTNQAAYDPGADSTGSPEVIRQGFRWNITRALTHASSTIAEWALNGTTKAKMYISGKLGLANGVHVDQDMALSVEAITDNPVFAVTANQTLTSPATYTVIQPTVANTATWTMDKGLNPFNGGVLFNAGPTLQYTAQSPSLQVVQGGFYALWDHVSYDGANLKAGTAFASAISVVNQPTIKNATTISTLVGLSTSGTIDSGGTVTTRKGVAHGAMTNSGTLTTDIGFHSSTSGATNTTHILIGTATPPTGNYGFYQGGTARIRFNTGIRHRPRDVTGTTGTQQSSDSRVFCTNAAAVAFTLGDARDYEAGYEFEIVQYGAGNVTVSAPSVSPATTLTGDTTTGGQYNTLRIIKRGTAEWVATRQS